ncbi:MAG TPA: MFS transporter [Chloroflexia bacterium]|nr:MFS transporter [Chloroflexia bacterium]
MEQTESATAARVAMGALADDQKRSLYVGIIVGFLLRLAGGAAGVLLGFYLNRVVSAETGGAVNPEVVGNLTAAFFAVELFLAPVFGGWSDRIGRKPFLLAGPLIAGLAVQLHPLTTLLWVIVIGRLLEGLATSATTPGTLGFLTDITGGNTALRGRVMGLYELGSLVGIGLGPALGGQLWDALGANGLRAISLVHFAAAGLVLLFIHETRPTHDAAGVPHSEHTMSWPERLRAYRHLMALPRLWRFAPAWIAINGIVGLWFNHVTPLLSRAVPDPAQALVGGWSGEQVRNAFLIFGLPLMVGIYFWSRLYARLRKTNIMLLAVAGTLGVCVVLYVINIHLLPATWGLWVLIPLLFAAIFVEAGFTPVALAYLADVTEGRTQDRGAVMGLYSVFLGLGQIIGAKLGAPFIGAWGFNGLLLCTAILAAVAGAAVLNLRHTTGD